MRSQADPRPRGASSVWALAGAMAVVAAGVNLALVPALAEPAAPFQLPWWALAALFFVVEICVVHLYFRRDAHSFTLSEIPLVLGLLFASPEALVLGGLLGTGVALAVARRQRPAKVAFNLALFTFEAVLAMTVYRLVAGSDTLGLQSVSAGFLATLATTLAGVLLVSLAIRLSEGHSRLQRTSQALGLGMLVTLANTSLALAAAAVLWQEPALGWLLLAPAAVLFLAYRAVVAQRQEHSHLTFLHEVSRLVYESLDTEEAVVSLLSQTRAKFRAEVAEMIVFPEDSGRLAFRTILGPGDSLEVMASVDRESIEWLRERIAAAEGATLLGLAGDSDAEALRRHLSPLVAEQAIVAPLQGEARILGVMLVAGRVGGVSTFDSVDLKLFATLGRHAGLALEKSRLEQSLARLTELDERLRASEAKYRTLAEQLPLVTYIRPLDLGKGNLYTSPQVVELLGYSVEQWESEPDLVSRIVHPEDRERVLAEAASLRRTGEPFHCEYRYITRDGEVVWVLDETHLVRHDSGEPMWVQGFLLDITERKTAEEARARLAAIVESSTDAIFSTTLEGVITSWNAGAQHMYGYGPGEVEGRHVSTLMPKEQLHEVDDILATIQRNESISHLETVRLRKGGSPFDVSVTVSPIKNESGELVGASDIQRDITERKQAQEKLRQKTGVVELLQAIAVAANESATLEDALQICLDRVCAHTGWPVGHVLLTASDPGPELVPTSLWHLERPDDFGPFREITETMHFAPGVGLPGRVLASGKPLWVMDVTVDSNFPRARWALEGGLCAGFAFPVLAGTEVAAVLEFFSTEAVEPDAALLEVMSHIGTQLGRVVERTRAEDSLLESEEHHRSIIETANDAFVAINPGGVITDWNRQAELTFGWTREEAIGRPLADTIIPSEYREAHRKGLERFLATGEATVLEKPLELTALHRDGREFPIELKIWPVLTKGGYHFNAFLRDITERTNLEDQLRQSQKMEAVGRLAGGVAHDFNNLLTAITGYSELLLDALGKDDPSRKRVEEIQRAAERAASLTHQLLAFSRRQVMQPKPLDLNAVVAEMDKMLRRLIGEDVELVTSRSDGLPHVKADPGQLEQVIVNLAVNARDAMPTGGRLAIATASVELDELSARRFGVIPGRYVELTVSDTGGGMDDETKAHIFEPFYTTKGNDKGTGLGLATVYGIVEQSGGHISVESSPGQGASFIIYLPVTEQPAALDARSSPGGRPQGTETILLVEDEEIVRNLVCEILETQGYTVLEAPGGQVAVETCRGHKGSIELMLTDVVMPGMSGRDLADRVGSLKPDMKVIYMSGYTDDAIVHHGVRQAEVAFLQKPFTSGELARKVRAVLEGTKDPWSANDGAAA